MRRFAQPALLFLILLPLAGHAQRNMITDGAIAYDDQAFGEALESLTTALENDENFKDKHYAKAYSYLAQSFTQIFLKKMQGQDTAKWNAVLRKYPNYATRTYEAYMKAEEYDGNGSYRDMNKRFYPIMIQMLYLEAFDLFQAEKPEEALATVNKAIDVVKKVDSKESYNPFMLRGLIYDTQLEKKAKAAMDYEEALSRYDGFLKQMEERMGKSGFKDPNMLNVYRNLIFIYSDQGKPIGDITALLKEARKRFPGKEDQISKWELQVYQNNEGMLAEALKKFEAAVAENPEDVSVRVSYANMLSKDGDTPAAIKQYKKALEHEPDNLIAVYNLGALYNNIAKRYGDKANASDDGDLVSQYREQQMDHAEKAYKYMKKANELDPDNPSTLRTLFNIAFLLEKPEKEYMKYKKRADELEQQKQ